MFQHLLHKIIIPLVGSLTSTCVTPPTIFPFCMIGLPLSPCTIPPVSSSRFLSSTWKRRPYCGPPASNPLNRSQYGTHRVDRMHLIKSQHLPSAHPVCIPPDISHLSYNNFHTLRHSRYRYADIRIAIHSSQPVRRPIIDHPLQLSGFSSFSFLMPKMSAR